MILDQSNCLSHDFEIEHRLMSMNDKCIGGTDDRDRHPDR